jgi:hypothetical protein
MMGLEYDTEQLELRAKRMAAKIPPDAADPFCQLATIMGVWGLANEASNTADDLYDVIESLRADKRFVESDRLRTLQTRLYAALDPLRALVGRPSDEQLQVLIARQEARRGAA